MNETALREQICLMGQRLARAGLVHGSTGNISCRLDDARVIVTPTGARLDDLDPAGLAVMTMDGRQEGGAAPTKEVFLHLSVYRNRSKTTNAIVHTHSTHSVAWSICKGAEGACAFPPITAYQMMRCGEVPLIPYYPPGDEGLAEAVGLKAKTRHALLLAAHGPVAAGKSLGDALGALEEMEETAKILLLLSGREYVKLSHSQIEDLNRRFPS